MKIPRQGKELLLLLPLGIAAREEKLESAPLFFWGSEHLFSLTTNDAARKYSCVEHQGSAVPCRKTELPYIGLGEELIFQSDSKIEKSSGKNPPFCLDHAGILFLLLNQLHCSVRREIFHPIPDGMVD